MVLVQRLDSIQSSRCVWTRKGSSMQRITIIISLSGAVLLFRQKKLGWIFAIAILLVFITIAGAGLIVTFNLRLFVSFLLVLVGESVLLLALFFCLQPAFRKKMLTDKKHYLSAFALTAILFTVYFVLQ